MTRFNGSVLAIGFLAGILGDALFNEAALGLNVPLWLGGLLSMGWALRRRGGDGDLALACLFGTALLFATFMAWRASPFLRSWNGFAVLVAGTAVAVQLRGRITRAWPEDYVRGAANLAGHVIAGAGVAATELRAPGRRDPAVSARIRASGIGVTLAVPVVFVFGALLSSADPAFETLATGLLRWDAVPLLKHALLVLALGWIATGWLRATKRMSTVDGGPMQPPVKAGLIEIAVPLAALTALLAMFIGLQARYLFGGEEVLRSAGFTYAEFARRGFFELVFLSALVVPLLYVVQRVLDRSARSALESFRALVMVLSVLVGLVMVSALARMRLYVEAYGLTEDRLYAGAFMVWVGYVLAWFALTELRAQPSRFTTGALLGGFAVLASLNIVNPDALIVRTNIARAGSGTELDAEYLGRLSVDAVPAAVAAWQTLSVETRCALERTLIARVQPSGDWRAWTWATSAAARSVRTLPADERCPGES